MITPCVIRAFDRLASGAILDVARRATPLPSPALVDSFMEEAFRLDSSMRSAYEDAKREDATASPSAGEPSKEELFRGDFERILEGIANGGSSSAKAVSNGDITHLMNMIRFMRRQREGGNDRDTKAAGIRETFQGFREGLSKAETRESTAKEIAAFVEEVFSGEMDWLMNSYLYSRKRGGDLKINLLTQDAGGSREKGKERARLTILSLLLEGTRNSIEKELYADKPSDGAVLGAIVAGVHHRISGRKTGDAYDDETAATGTRGGQQARGKWGKYIAPLQDTGKFGHGESLDILGITEFLNEHFLRKDLDSRTPVEAPLPGGGTMTAPSFKTKLKSTKVHQWATGASAGVSIDTPIGEGDEGGTLGETIGAPDTPYEKTEEGVVEWLEAPAETDSTKTNRDVVRADIRGWVDEAMRRASVTPANLSAVGDILLVKLGFMSSEPERSRFLEKWLSESIPKFRAEAISSKIWNDKLDKPLIRGWESAPRPADKGYKEEWKQQSLTYKETGEPFVGRLDTLKKLLRQNPDSLEIVTKVHKKGDTPKTFHFLNWMKYGQEDREADLNRALDVYDGEKWFEQSVDKSVRDELKEQDSTLAEAFEKFDPASIFTPVAKHSDTELIRAMGYVKPSIAPQTGETLFQNYSGIQPDIRSAIRKLGEVMVEESEEDDGALQYLSLKHLGKVASRIKIETIISAVVTDLAGTSE